MMMRAVSRAVQHENENEAVVKWLLVYVHSQLVVSSHIIFVNNVYIIVQVQVYMLLTDLRQKAGLCNTRGPMPDIHGQYLVKSQPDSSLIFIL